MYRVAALDDACVKKIGKAALQSGRVLRINIRKISVQNLIWQETLRRLANARTN